MITQTMEWEAVKFNATGKKGRQKSVWVEKVGKTSKMYSRFKISSDLVDELGWTDGTRVNLYRSGATYKLVPAKTGLITLKKVGKVLFYNNWSMCAELRPDLYGPEYTAYVLGNELYFYGKEE